jgi:hypothetical protein
MFYAICDYAKVLVCNHLPSDVSLNILTIIEYEMQIPVKNKMKQVLMELQDDDRVIYYKLLTQSYEKYIDNWQALYALEIEDCVVRHYVRNLAFAFRMCAEAEPCESFSMFEVFLMHSKAKDGYIWAMQHILTI